MGVDANPTMLAEQLVRGLVQGEDSTIVGAVRDTSRLVTSLEEGRAQWRVGLLTVRTSASASL